MFPIRSLILCTAAMVAPLLTSGPTVHVAGTAHTAIVAEQFPHGWAAEGYDGTDAGLAQYAYDHGQLIEGYGVDVTKVYDLSKPYGWKANPDTGEGAYVEYCGDASLAEGEGEPEVDRATGKRCAAEMILLRVMSSQHVEEDWTWQGMPAAVAEFNDALIADWRAAGSPQDWQHFLGRVALVDSAF